MLFQKSVLESLFEKVENTHKIPFWKIFCNLVDDGNLAHSGASEYEIYFNFVVSSTNKVSIRKLKNANIISIDQIKIYKNMKFDFVSLHTWNRKD